MCELFLVSPYPSYFPIPWADRAVEYGPMRKFVLVCQFVFTCRLFSVGVNRLRQREIQVDSLIYAVNMIHSTLSPMSRSELQWWKRVEWSHSKIFNWNLIFDSWGIIIDSWTFQRDTTNAIQRGNGLDLGADFDSKCSGDDGALVDKVYRWERERNCVVIDCHSEASPSSEIEWRITRHVLHTDCHTHKVINNDSWDKNVNENKWIAEWDSHSFAVESTKKRGNSSLRLLF